MRMQWLPLIAVLLLNIAIDVFIYRQLKAAGHNVLSKAHIAIAVIATACLAFCGAVLASGTTSLHTGTLLVMTYFMVYIPKFIGTLIYLPGMMMKKRTPGRRMAAYIAATIGLLVFALMVWGYFVTPRQIQVNEATLEFDNLPTEFDGYKIVQFSDAHLGSFAGDTAFVARFVKRINEMDADAVFFTGDLVSTVSAEALPYRNTLSRIKAKDGVFSVLGNHDYDDYCRWMTPEQRDSDRLALRQLQQGMGWKMLNNATSIIGRGGDSIAIIGIENYGDKPFPIYGTFSQAYHGNATDSVFKIVLQHNPYMWRHALVGKTNTSLTLSGHTHAMQTVLLGWSPSCWRYKEWAGLYNQGGQYLYVNTGLGTVGPPMRIGVAPEITLITLRTKKHEQ